MHDLTAVILCGGKGERLRPLTNGLPKPLLTLRGRPILEHLLTHLSRGGIRRFAVCVGYQAELVERFVDSARRGGLEIRCVNSGEAAMNDRILDASAGIAGPILICYGDTLAAVDLSALERHHAASGALATVTVHPMRSAFGIVEFNGASQVTGIVEKPFLPYWINIGFLYCDPPALGYMRRNASIVDFCTALSTAGRLSAYQHKGQHVTINTEGDLLQAETELAVFTGAQA